MVQLQSKITDRVESLEQMVFDLQRNCMRLQTENMHLTELNDLLGKHVSRQAKAIAEVQAAIAALNKLGETEVCEQR